VMVVDGIEKFIPVRRISRTLVYEHDPGDKQGHRKEITGEREENTSTAPSEKPTGNPPS